MWGIIPAAGQGTRIQPLAFSKELLPVGTRTDGTVERPRAVGEYLVDRMIQAGADKICFVISPLKSDILHYFGGSVGSAEIAYVVQGQARGLCDAIFRALPLIRPDESVMVGMPDTIWFPEAGLTALPDDRLAFLLFPVERPELFDSVVTDAAGAVREIQVKVRNPPSKWVWGAFKLPGAVLADLHALWRARDCRDEYIGTLVNAYLGAGGSACAVRAGESYVDVGTVDGYRQAIRLLGDHREPTPQPATQALAEIGAPETAAHPVPLSGDELQRRIESLGPWFHNIELGAIRTAPDHFLGDYPAVKWQRFAHAIPADLR